MTGASAADSAGNFIGSVADVAIPVAIAHNAGRIITAVLIQAGFAGCTFSVNAVRGITVNISPAIASGAASPAGKGNTGISRVSGIIGNIEILRFLYRDAVTAEPDSQGRVVLNTTLIEHAKIIKDAVVVGCGDYSEIWSAEEYDRIVGDEDADELREALEAMGL